MDPTDVTAPKGRVQVVRVIYVDKQTGLAHALLFWDKEPVLGSHYCGNVNDPNDKGMPLSSGHPVWFIQDQPKAIIDALTLSGNDRRLAETFLKLNETVVVEEEPEMV